MNEPGDELDEEPGAPAELQVGMQELKAEMQQLRGDVFEQLRADHQWTIGLIVGIYATSIATLLAILFKSH